jgi:hypothetical protein
VLRKQRQKLQIIKNKQNDSNKKAQKGGLLSALGFLRVDQMIKSA